MAVAGFVEKFREAVIASEVLDAVGGEATEALNGELTGDFPSDLSVGALNPARVGVDDVEVETGEG